MSGLVARVRSLWAALRRPARLEAEMDEEMRFHIEMEADRIAREQGVEAEEARRRARIAFGGVEKRKEEGRDARGLGWMSGLSLDLKLAWRMLARSPGLAVVGVLGLGLGIAISVGFFVLLATLFFPRLPLEEGDRVVALENRDAGANRESRRSLHDFHLWREEMRSVEPIGAASIGARRLATGDAPSEPVRAAEMTAAGFRIARVPPLLGRWLVEEDEREGAPAVVVIGYDLWQERFEADPRAIGRTVLVGDQDHVIVGVMPRGFRFPENQELWTALRASPARHARGEGPELFVFGRLAPGATPQRAQAELAALGRRAAADFPDTNARLRPRVLPYTHPFTNTDDLQLWEVAQIQLLVNLLLVAIAVNIAVLVYARTATRQGEIAVRTALGATRRRIVTQLFVEALVLALLGAGLGLGAAHVVLGRIDAMFAPGGSPFWEDHGLQPRSVAFALALAIVCAVIVGVAPALRATGRRLHADLRRVGGGSTVRLGRGWAALIVAQVAVALAVLPTALGLGVREIRSASWRPTFPAEEILAAQVGLAVPLRPGMDGAEYRRETAARMADRIPALEQRLEADPGVVGATLEGRLPGRGTLVEVEGAPGRHGNGAHALYTMGVAPDYFELLGARVLAGRGLRPSDATGTGGLVVTRAFVQGVLGSDDALGRRVRFHSPEAADAVPGGVAAGPWLEIVGVVSDLRARTLGPEAGAAAVYYAVAPGDLPSVDLLVRVRGGADAFSDELRRSIAAVDPAFRVASVENLARRDNVPYLATVTTVLVLALGTVVLLSAAGVHALMSLTVTRRRREIGIRTALGARPGRVLASVFARAAWQIGLGALAGSVLGAALLRSTGLVDSAAVPVGGVLVLMLAAGLLAALGPARRGLRVQPMEALRAD